MLGETAQRASHRSRDTSLLAKSSSEQCPLPGPVLIRVHQQSETELMALMAVPREGSTSAAVSANSSPGGPSFLWQEPAVE